MAWTSYQVFLAGMLIVTGSINTLATKWADKAESVGKNGELRQFNHPFLQALGMFFGEFTCLIAFKAALAYYRKKGVPDDLMPASVTGNRSYNPFIFFPPAVFDLMATSIMYVGLNLTNASSFQMLRGALIVFTGLLSVAFLNRKLRNYEWLGIFFVILGLIIVGTSDLIYGKGGDLGVKMMITGDLLIIIAQVLTATQMVLEEKFVSSRNVSPLEAVGWEGVFGFLTMAILLLPMYYIKVGQTIFKNPDANLEDPIDAWYQMKNNWVVMTGFIGTVLSISFFNFAGISVTKEISATTRTVLDSVRTFVVWLVSLMAQWETFSLIQLTGFFVLMIGMFLYNNVIIRPAYLKYVVKRPSTETEPVIAVTPPEDGRGVDNNALIT